MHAHNNKKPTTVASILLTLAIAVAQAQPTTTSPAPSQPVTEQLHGISISDPYRNLEDMKDPATRAWLKSQGAAAAAQLAGIEGRDALIERIGDLRKAAATSIHSVLRMPGNRVYYMRRLPGENQYKLVLRSAGVERVLVDPQSMGGASAVPHAINYYRPSWDGRRLAFGVSAGGSEDAALQVMDVASGRALGAPIPHVPLSQLHWTPDSRQISFTRVRDLPPGAPDTETYLDATVFLLDIAAHTRGDAQAMRPLFGPLVNPELKLDRLDFGEVIFAPGSRYMLARTTDTTIPEGRLFVAPLPADSRAARRAIAWRAVSRAEDKITHARMRGGTLYVRSYAAASRGHILAMPLARPVLGEAREVVPEPARGVLESFTLTRHGIVTEVREGFNMRPVRHAAGDPPAGMDMAPQKAGVLQFTEDAAAAYDDPWVMHRSWTMPDRLLALKAGTVVDTGILSGAVPPHTPDIVVTEAMVPSHDGVKVPAVILHRKGLVLDGSHPALLVGYGAYGLTINAGYDPRRLAWLEQGGVLAYANVRGSGAFGDAWHRAGFKDTKPNTWKDGLAVAHHLVDQGYTSPGKLGIWGTSAGGIFVGRAVTTEPALFAAAIFDVGLMDSVRAELSANGATNTSEFGSMRNAQDLPAMLAMSTYHQIKDGTAYPAVMLVHGLNDPRVDVWHSAKAAARLQAASSSGRPILLRLDEQAGHGIGSTASQGDTKLADIYSFLLWQAGLAKVVQR